MYDIMIVDDANIMRKTLRQLFTELGHNVVAEASNGFEAIELYKEKKPTIVSLDITMPAVNGIHDGIEALEEIIKHDPEANIIMLTSHGEQKLVMDAILKGAKGYVLKPADKHKIQDAIEKLKL
jgi:two-component system chemotaxis response regulator CheY